MKKPLLISLAAAVILSSDASAATMFEQFKQMQLELDTMKSEMKELKASKSSDIEDEDEVDEDDEGVSEDEDSEEEDEDSEDTEDSEDEDEDEDDEVSVEEQIADLEEEIGELNKQTSGNRIKWGVDLRTSLDNLNYKMADGTTQKNDALLTNRLWLNMNWAASENMSFTGQLAYNKAYGARSGSGSYAPMETFDWISNENPYDDVVRVRSAYFFYKNDTFVGADIPWTFSIGRRPSLNGHLINYRDDDSAASPQGHSINVEFDGLSSKFSFEELTGIEGMYVKFCAGRGGTNANARFMTVNPQTAVVSQAAPYATNENDIPNIDLGGLIFVPYDNGQYSIATQFYYANNLIDADITYQAPQAPGFPVINGFKTVGGIGSATLSVTIDGIGDEWSDFLDETLIFGSASFSQTDPSLEGGGMLGSTEKLLGYSAWIGTQFPSLISEEGRWGLEYNKGSQNWRSITYGEDTYAGSKIATRGDAYEAYFTEPLVDDYFSLQIRYTYLDYKYTGSNGFFGNATGTPILIETLTPQQGAGSVVDTAQDVRVYLRYRY